MSKNAYAELLNQRMMAVEQELIHLKETIQKMKDIPVLLEDVTTQLTIKIDVIHNYLLSILRVQRKNRRAIKHIKKFHDIYNDDYANSDDSGSDY